MAIAIPVFSSQLEKSRDSVSISNMRAAYAEAVAAYLTANGKAVAQDGNVQVYEADENGKQAVYVSNVEIKTQDANDWSNLSGELPFTAPADEGEPETKTMIFTFTLGSSANPTATFNAG